MNKILVVLVGICLLLATACASPQPQPLARTYDRPNTSRQEFLKDRYECIQESRVEYSASRGGTFASRSLISCAFMFSCMEGRGYTIYTDGSGMAPSQPVSCYLR